MIKANAGRPELRKLAHLEALRAVCALVVLLNHALTVFAVPEPPTLVRWVANCSTEAVLLFFLLSGAVITHSLALRPRSTSAFIRDRLIRIYPVYAIAIGLAAAAVWISQANAQALPIWLANALFLQSWTGSPFPLLELNRPLWSLPYEMFYYAVVALLLWRRDATAVLISALVVLLLALRAQPTAAYALLLIGLAPAFFAGAAMVRYRQRLPELPLFLGIASGLACLLGSKALEGHVSELLRQNLYALGSVPMLWAMYTEQRHTPPRLLVWLGSISFALYALHHPLFVIANRIGDGFPWLLRLLLGVVLTLLTAALVERWLQPKIKASFRKTPSLR